MKVFIVNGLLVSLLALLISACGGGGENRPIETTSSSGDTTEKVVFVRSNQFNNNVREILTVDVNNSAETVLTNNSAYDHHVLQISSNKYLIYAEILGYVDPPNGTQGQCADQYRYWGSFNCFAVINIYSIRIDDIGTPNATPIALSVDEQQVEFLDVSGDNRVIYSVMLNGKKDIAMINVDGTNRDTAFLGGSWERKEYITTTTDNRIIFYAYNSVNEQGAEITEMSMLHSIPADASSAVTRIASNSFHHEFYAVTDDNKVLFHGRYPQQGHTWALYSANSDGSNEVTLADSTTGFPDPDNTNEEIEYEVATDDSWYVFTKGSNLAYSVKQDGSGVINLANLFTDFFYLGNTNDNKIVFSGGESAQSQMRALYSGKADGSELSILSSSQSVGYLGATANNRLIIRPGNTNTYYAVNSDGSNLKLLTDNAAYAEQISLSGKMLYDYNDQGSLYLHIVDTEGQNDLRLSEDAFHYLSTSTIDHKVIYGRDGSRGGTGYFIVNEDGSNKISLGGATDDRILLAVLYDKRAPSICDSVGRNCR